MNIGDKYLPIGTVCILKGGEKRLMITGYCTIPKEKNKIFDYSGCPYPEGVISFEKTFLFDHENIEKIFHLGYYDAELYSFQNQLKDVVSKIESGEIKLDDINVSNTINNSSDTDSDVSNKDANTNAN